MSRFFHEISKFRVFLGQIFPTPIKELKSQLPELIRKLELDLTIEELTKMGSLINLHSASTSDESARLTPEEEKQLKEIVYKNDYILFNNTAILNQNG